MDARPGPQAAGGHDGEEGTLAIARLQIQALTDNGMSPEMLLRALLEKYPAQVPSSLWPPRPESCFAASPSSPSSCASPTSTNNTNGVPVPISFDQTIAAAFETKTPGSGTSIVGDDRQNIGPKHHAPRLSVSTTRTTSSVRSRASVMSSATSISSTSSQGSMGRYSQLPGTQQFNSRPSTRAYWCTSCPQKLQRKFDWKRHEDEFHERYKKYPCPDCNRVFWGANTFNQHHKSRHACTTCPHADKVVRYSRRKRAWGCGFCAAFLPSLERYFDHVAVHYESGKTKAHWDHALVIYGLLHQPVIHETWKALEASKYGSLPREQRPKISWDPKNTGRAHGYLENEEPGQLQDLLEFFDPSRDEAKQIVELAWETAIQVPVVALDQASVRRPSLYMGNGQGADGLKQEDSQHLAQMPLPQNQRPLPRQPSTQLLPQSPREQILQPKQEWPSSTETLAAPNQDWPLVSDASSVHSAHSIAPATSPLPPGIQHTSTVAPQQLEPQSQLTVDAMVLDRPLPDPMVLDQRPVTFEQTFFSPVQMQYPTNGPPAHPIDYTSFDGAVDFGGGIMYAGSDWNHLAGSMVAGDAALNGPGPDGQSTQQLHQQQHTPSQEQLQERHKQQQQQQQQQDQQQQQQQQQQQFWSNGLYTVQS